MRRYTGFGSIAAIVSAILVAVSLTSATPSVADHHIACESIEASLTSNFTSPITTTGVIHGDLEGTTHFTLGILEPEVPTETTDSYTGTLVITTDHGTLTTFGTGVFEPVPFGLGTQFDRVTDGTGKFEGATGVLFFNFVADATGAGFTADIMGEICTVE